MFFPNSQIRLLAKYPGTFFPSRDKIESKTVSPYMFQYAYLAWLLALRYFDSGKGIIECTWVNQETSVLCLFMFLIISKSGFSTLVTQRCTGQPGAWLLCQQSYLPSYCQTWLMQRGCEFGPPPDPRAISLAFATWRAQSRLRLWVFSPCLWGWCFVKIILSFSNLHLAKRFFFHSKVMQSVYFLWKILTLLHGFFPLGVSWSKPKTEPGQCVSWQSINQHCLHQ